MVTVGSGLMAVVSDGHSTVSQHLTHSSLSWSRMLSDLGMNALTNNRKKREVTHARTDVNTETQFSLALLSGAF